MRKHTHPHELKLSLATYRFRKNKINQFSSTFFSVIKKYIFKKRYRKRKINVRI